ncbi:hypothetical protein Ddc_13311 [Ditylenchus destructor]|nr:hypothetical protein Ddc_13311 [Ditylenchus destructor]
MGKIKQKRLALGLSLVKFLSETETETSLGLVIQDVKMVAIARRTILLDLAYGTLAPHSAETKVLKQSGDRGYRKAPHGEMGKTYGREIFSEKTASREQVPEVNGGEY